jgi:ACS family tartrate transporter-like MFS transporter
MQGAWLAIVQGLFRGRCAAAAIAAINTLSILGGFVGPYFMGFLKDVTGNYQRGLSILALPMLVAAAVMLNLRRQAARASQPAVPQPILGDALESPNV